VYAWFALMVVLLLMMGMMVYSSFYPGLLGHGNVHGKSATHWTKHFCTEWDFNKSGLMEQFLQSYIVRNYIHARFNSGLKR